MLLKQTALTLGLVVSSCFAATYQKCTGFLAPVEGSKYTPSLRIKAGKNDGASVLVFELKDSLYTNIDINGIDDSNLLNSTNNDFFLCTQEFLDAGKCDELDTFNLEIKEEQQIKKQILNKHLKANETLKYEIDAKGVYCVATYSKVKHNVNIFAMQSFGYASLEDHYTAEFLKYLVIPASVIIAVTTHMSLRKTSKEERLLENSILTFSVLVTVYNITKFANFEASEMLGSTVGAFEWFSFAKTVARVFGAQLQSILLVVIICKIYSWAMGFQVFRKNPENSPNHILLWWFSYMTYQSVMSKHVSHKSPYYDYLGSFIELLLLYTIFKQSQDTLRKIEFPDVKRRYRMSMIASLSIPLFIGLTCIVLSAAIGMKYGINSIASFNPWKNGQKALSVDVLEQTLMSRAIVYLSSLSDLVFVGLSLAYALIWSGGSPEQELSDKKEPETPKKFPVKKRYAILNMVAMVCVSVLFDVLQFRD